MCRCGFDGGSVDQHRPGACHDHAGNDRREPDESTAGRYTDTLDHQHLALNEIHRATGHDQLFDTVFVYENYPIDTAALLGVQELSITDFTNREYNHYPLSVQAVPGHELGLRVEYDTNVFDRQRIKRLVNRLQRVLVAMTADMREKS